MTRSSITLWGLAALLTVLLALQTHRLHQEASLRAAHEAAAPFWDGSTPPSQEAIDHARAVLDRAREDRPFLDAEDEAAAALLADAIAEMMEGGNGVEGMADVIGSKQSVILSGRPSKAAARNRKKAAAKRADKKASDKNKTGEDSEEEVPRDPVRSKKLAASAKRMIQQGSYEAAAETLRESIEADPRNARSYRALADLYRKMGLAEEEAQIYQDWMASLPDDALPHYFMANAMLRAGADSEVLAQLTQFQALSGETMSSYPMAASIYSKLGMQAEAGMVLQDWVNEVPNSVDARGALAQHYRQTGDYQASLAEYQVVADLLPDNVASHANLADAYQRLNMYAEAQIEYAEALNMRPNSTAIRNNLANSYRRGGDLYAAYEMYQSVVDMAPGTTDARRASANMRRIQNQLNRNQKANA